MSSGARKLLINLLVIIVSLVLVATVSRGCGVKIPEEGTAQALLFRERCTECHDLIAPQSMTPKMWETIIGRLDGNSKRGHPALPTEVREPLLDYIMRNAYRRR